MTDPVNHPQHYNFSNVEPIEAIEAWGLGYNLGNVVSYIARHQHKGNPLLDLKKARWHLEREIARLEAKPQDEPAEQLNTRRLKTPLVLQELKRPDESD
jgi:hypothetical protein